MVSCIFFSSFSICFSFILNELNQRIESTDTPESSLFYSSVDGLCMYTQGSETFESLKAPPEWSVLSDVVANHSLASQ